jgi:4-hydroxy-3-methylbut-2-enyl diphosphate reductase
LYEVCRKHNPATYFISNPNDLEKVMFNKLDKVGICGATSTPMWLMEQVKGHLEAY